MDEELKRLMLVLTQHADDLQLYANGIAEDAMGELAATEEAIYKLIDKVFAWHEKNGMPMDYSTFRYFKDLHRKIEKIRNAAFDEEEEKMAEVSREVAKEQSGFLSDFYSFLTGAAVAGPTKKQLENIAKYGIYNGNTVGQIFDKLWRSDVNRIFDAITNSLQMGRTVGDAMDAVRRELRKSRRFIKSEIETIINGVANDATLAFAATNRTKLVYSAVLDEHVCGECAEFDGQVFEYDDRDIPSLPRHINCRCSFVPISNEGEKISPATFAEYLASMSAKDQRWRLGAAKYSAWRSGNYQLGKYETPNRGQRRTIWDVTARREEAMRQTNIDLDPHGLMNIKSPAPASAISSLRHYTCGENGLYRQINQYMTLPPSAPQNPALDKDIKNIKIVMGTSTLKEDTLANRGLRSKKVFDTLMSGTRETSAKSFQSMSLSREVSSEYAGHVKGESVLIKVLLPKGTHCVDVSKISTASKPEDEILVDGGGKYLFSDIYYNEKTQQLEVTARYAH